VEPKRKALQSANDELAAAQDKLTKIKAKIKVCLTSGCDMMKWSTLARVTHLGCVGTGC